LIDSWDYDEYGFALEDAPQMAEVRAIYTEYFRGDPRKTLAEAYDKTRARFAADADVAVLKLDIAAAARQFPDASFDFIYLDGNHTYEYVLRDLYTWFPKLRPGGLFACNDFFESPFAARQNLSVIPAFVTFAKRFPVYPVALAAAEWSDLYFSNAPTSPRIAHFLRRLHASPFPLVDLPDELLGAYHHKMIEQPEHPPRLLPSFRLASPAEVTRIEAAPAAAAAQGEAGDAAPADAGVGQRTDGLAARSRSAIRRLLPRRLRDRTIAPQ
jgi:hypothetical protein